MWAQGGGGGKLLSRSLTRVHMRVDVQAGLGTRSSCCITAAAPCWMVNLMAAAAGLLRHVDPGRVCLPGAAEGQLQYMVTACHCVGATVVYAMP